MRELKGRIGSVHSSQKMTGAMKMIASARLRQVENKLAQARPYQQKLWDIYAHIRQSECDYVSPLSEKREVERVALVAFASDEGLCGIFNVNIAKKVAETVSRYKTEGIKDITVIPVGKKIFSDVRRITGIRFQEAPAAFAEKDFVKGTRELADHLMEAFLSKRYDRVEVVYTYYKSMGTQIPMVHPFLPLSLDRQDKVVTSSGLEPWYILEPDAESIMATLYPLLLHALMYELCLSTRTSEQAARILAMQTANDNASKLLDELQLEYNKLRQQSITSELLDIAGGSNVEG